MIEKVRHEDVIKLLDDGAQLVEVLPREEYEEFHIRGAQSLPLKELNADSAAGLDKHRPIIVYCNSSL